MDTETLKAMVDRLQELADGAEPDSRSWGICNDIFNHTGHTSASDLVADKSKNWKEFSGSPSYPVPHKDGPRIGYNSEDDLWSGEYGAARRRLCGFLASEIRKEIG